MRRCVFMDRDGVINVAPRSGEYVRSAAEFQLIDSVVDWIRIFNALDLLVIVVTNQRAVARGLMSLEDLDEVHRKMCSELAVRGARLDDIFRCIHEEGACACRKPRPGMVYDAAAKWDIDVRGSLMIGDSARDRKLAEACGMRYISVESGRVSAVLG